MTAALHALSVAELGALYRRGELSPVEVARDVIAHVQRCEPTLHATWAFDPEAALAMAREAQTRYLRAQPLSALDGVPVTIKENIATQGLPLAMGSAASVLVPAAADAPPAARLREAGAVFIARTTMPDYGMLSSGLSSFHAQFGGPARNPWDLSKTPGGSSAGAGAAAAAGYGPLHLGTDIGGSIRLPAGWCGIFGLKPSNGRIPIQPPYAGRAAGPMTRSVRDAALAMAVLSQPDWRDAASLPYQPLAWDDLNIELRGLKIGLLMDAGWGLAVDPEIASAVRAAAQRFEAAGAHIEEMAAFTTREMADGINLFWRMRSWLDIAALPPERRARVLPYIREWVAAGESCSAAQLFHGYSQMAALRDAAVAACRPFDFVLSPVSPVPAFAAEHASPTNDPLRAMEHIGFTLPYNMSEQPAASIDCGHTTAGLPIGLQIIGTRHDDLGVLRLAHAWEQMRPAPRPWPTI